MERAGTQPTRRPPRRQLLSQVARLRPLFACALALGLCAACDDGGSALGGGADAARHGPRRVLVVVVDTLRADFLAAPDGSARTTDAPRFFERFAARALDFTHARAASSWTAPSTATIFTGLVPVQHGVRRGRMAALAGSDGTLEVDRIPRAIDTLPMLAADAGYATFGVAANPNLSVEQGFARGFDHFENTSATTLEAAGLIDRLLDWRTELESAPQAFVYLHFMDPHGPYHLREEFLRPHEQLAPATRAALDAYLASEEGASHLLEGRVPSFTATLVTRETGLSRAQALEVLRACYRSEIAYLEQQLDRLWRELGIDDEWFVALTADHGEEFGEHGAVGHPYELYDELLRVPLLVAPHADGWDEVPREDARPATHADLVATLREVLGADPDPRVLGSSLLAPPVAGRPWSGAQFASRTSMTDPGRKRSIVRDEVKLVVDARNGIARLFDLVADPLERTNLAAERLELSEALFDELEAFEATAPRLEPERYVGDQTAADAELLRWLGYLQDGPKSDD
ncbi:Sulfatase [Planctomycetes bacterium Pla163]|uniref:Sulfatase n=1 Tax=Rohdeia mirabilis TaxID=2528008 RepID=A0A518CZX1_9BACT|nr:Sulfatase [Planctomycetes bacterium Pla163]